MTFNKKIEEREEIEVKAGRGTKADLAEATMRCVAAEMDLHDAITSKSTPDLSPDPASPGRARTAGRAASEGSPSIWTSVTRMWPMVADRRPGSSYGFPSNLLKRCS